MRQLCLPMTLALALMILAAAPVLVTGAQARPARLAFVDDDWEPSEGKSEGAMARYESDPGYEVYIREALAIADLPYDEFEIWPDGAGDPQRPTLSELTDYPLLLWNCAANDSAVLQPVEIQLLVDYMDLGGKVLLAGQGILDDLARHAGEPLYDSFQEDILGIAMAYLNYEATAVQSIPAGYFADLGTFVPQYGGLPDGAPDRVDPFAPMPGMESYQQGVFPTHPYWTVPVSSDRLKWQPLHFQSWMFSSMADPIQRGQWMSASVEWLGLEGESLYDFMNGDEDFEQVLETPPHIVMYDSADRHLVFRADGSQLGETRLEKDLLPMGGDWRIGETFMVTEAGEDSEMRLLVLEGYRGVDVSLRSSQAWPGRCGIALTLSQEGLPVFEDGCDGLPTDKIFRAQLSLRTDTGPELHFALTDSVGNPYWSTYALFDPLFDRCALVAGGEGLAGAQPILGWMDDLFFEGSLSHEGGTAVQVSGFDIEAAEGGVDLSWVLEGSGNHSFLLSRDGDPVHFEDMGGWYLARDRDPSLTGGGRFLYELRVREGNEEWNLLYCESVELPAAGLPAVRLLGASPNPFNPATEIRFELDFEAPLRIEIVGLDGRHLRGLLAGIQPAGGGSVVWDGRDDAGNPLASGVYLLRFGGPGVRQTDKLVLLK